MNAPPSFRFPSRERLKSRKTLDALFVRDALHHFAYPFRVHFRISPKEGESLQVAFSVSKRKFRLATDRNRIRRRMREAWRMECQPLRDILNGSAFSLCLVFLYSGKPGDETWPVIRRGIRKAIRLLTAQVDGIPPVSDQRSAGAQ
ncbi:MAG: ribonuclease P protein component [Saprospiraceae bacterium]|nr:ribonuclease P protein component [Saprospiraceae bacterium]